MKLNVSRYNSFSPVLHFVVVVVVVVVHQCFITVTGNVLHEISGSPPPRKASCHRAAVQPTDHFLTTVGEKDYSTQHGVRAPTPSFLFKT